jgi:hypothetical protein
VREWQRRERGRRTVAAEKPERKRSEVKRRKEESGRERRSVF